MGLCHSWLKDGTVCSSKTEAYLYIKLRGQKTFLHNKKYPLLGSCRYDFYIPEENKYIEVTSYNKKRCKWWFAYLRKIVKKRNHVKNTLKANFEFIVKRLTRHEMRVVRANMKFPQNTP